MAEDDGGEAIISENSSEKPRPEAQGSEATISENSSEKPRRGRGRPRAFDANVENAYWGIGLLQDGQTRRNHLNVLWFAHGLAVLRRNDEPLFRYLFGDVKEVGSKMFRRKTVIAELGRIEDEAEMLAVARDICEKKPKAREAIAMIRGYRLYGHQLDGRPFASRVNLMDAIIRTIEEYRGTHQEVTSRFVIETLEDCVGWYDEEDDEDDEDEEDEPR
jgi:hypothetical protein